MLSDLVVVFSEPSAWIGLVTLTALEIVLGIDNLVFVAIVTERLPEEQRTLGRRAGLGLALIGRLVLLFSIAWIMGLTEPFATFTVFGHHVEVTGQSLILVTGGLFLIYKATTEIHHKVELKDQEIHTSGKGATLGVVLVNIALMDLVFSLDSVITAVGLVGEIPVMVVAIVIAMGVMIWFADPVSEFVSANPAIKILALSFLMLIGVLLTAEAFEFGIPKGYVYFAMAFSLVVELIQMRYQSNVDRHTSFAKETPG